MRWGKTAFEMPHTHSCLFIRRLVLLHSVYASSTILPLVTLSHRISASIRSFLHLPHLVVCFLTIESTKQAPVFVMFLLVLLTPGSEPYCF